MKPTAQQVKNLQEYLHDTLTYRETYEEIYDHILTALEHQSEGVSYQDAINNIIRNDFGGAENLLKIEKVNKSALVDESLKKYMGFFKGYFKSLGIIYTGSATLLIYYFLSHVSLSVMFFELILAVLTLLIPVSIAVMRLFNTGYFLDTTRKSARDKMFEYFAGGPSRLLIILNIWAFKTSVLGVWFNAHPYIVTLVIMVCAIYNLALYKLYKDEFKTAMAQ